MTVHRLQRLATRCGRADVAIEGKANSPFEKALLGSAYSKGVSDTADTSDQRPMTLEGGSQWQL